jgi:hypothetical protein
MESKTIFMNLKDIEQLVALEPLCSALFLTNQFIDWLISCKILLKNTSDKLSIYLVYKTLEFDLFLILIIFVTSNDGLREWV